MAISDNMRRSLFEAGLGILGSSGPGTTLAQSIGGALPAVQGYYGREEQAALAQQAAEEQARQQQAVQAATQQFTPEMQQLMMQNPEAAADLLFKQQMASHEELLKRSRPTSLADRYQNVPGVGLVDLGAVGGPEVEIAGRQGPETIVNVGGEAETEFAKQTAKTGAKAVQDLQAGINSREQQAVLLDQILSVAEDAPSGPLANLELFTGQLGQALGVQTEGVEAGEVLRAASNQLALLVRGNPEGGLPGAASNRDVQFLLDSGPQLGQTKAGRKALAKISKETLNYRNRIARAEQDYRQKNLGSVVGFDPSKVKKPNIAAIVKEARGIVQRSDIESGAISTQDLQGMSDDDLSRLWQ